MNAETKQIKQGQLFLQGVIPNSDRCMTTEEFNVAITKLKKEIENIIEKIDENNTNDKNNKITTPETYAGRSVRVVEK